jgi:hypothetical protein
MSTNISAEKSYKKWAIVFCGVGLECDMPILEALFITTFSKRKPTRNVSAYTMWARNWRNEHPKQALPAMLWKERCKENPYLKDEFQALADEFNAD